MLQTLYHVSEYKEELLYPAVCKAMDALSIADDLRSGLKVVIKPNLVMAKSPDFPVTTHPLDVYKRQPWQYPSSTVIKCKKRFHTLLQNFVVTH